MAAAGARLIHVHSNWRYYFKPSSEVLQANEIINREIVAANPPFYLVLEGTEPDLFKRWEVLKQIRDLCGFLLTLPGITSSMSIVDGLELFGAGLNKGAESGELDEQGNVLAHETPKSLWEDSNSLAAPLKFVALSPNTFNVTEDFQTAAVLVRTKLTGSREIEEAVARIRDYVAKQFPTKIHAHLTDNVVLLTGTASDIVAGQIKSLSLALAVSTSS